jgi:hypothetical protein
MELSDRPKGVANRTAGQQKSRLEYQSGFYYMFILIFTPPLPI